VCEKKVITAENWNLMNVLNSSRKGWKGRVSERKWWREVWSWMISMPCSSSASEGLADWDSSEEEEYEAETVESEEGEEEEEEEEAEPAGEERQVGLKSRRRSEAGGVQQVVQRRNWEAMRRRRV